MAQNVRTPPDHYELDSSELDSPARFAYEIEPVAAGTDLAVVTRGLYIGSSGNLYCRPSGHANNLASAPGGFGGEHANVFFMNVTAGTILPLRLDKVWIRNETDVSQNTTARHLVGLY